jgi:hypothetical protein
MSIVLVPGQFHGEPHPSGKLASTLLSVTVAGMADPSRFRRGKTYVADHAVTRLEVEPGTLQASVMGSRDHPYHVVVSVRLVERVVEGSGEALRAQLTRLTPEANDLMSSCTCPDDDEPCKHVVAALLAFAAELVARPELLVQWRCRPSGEVATRPTVGSRARPSERHLRLAPTPAARQVEPPSPWEEPEWVEFLGSPPPAPPAIPAEPVAVGRATLGLIDLSAVVRDALDALAPGER